MIFLAFRSMGSTAGNVTNDHFGDLLRRAESGMDWLRGEAPADAFRRTGWRWRRQLC
jgi:hypothetical protein